MKLEVNEIYHNYIVRMVIFGIFLYKGEVRNSSKYKAAVHYFLKKRIPWKINLIIDTGPKLGVEEEREIFLNNILYNIESDYMNIINVKFITPIKEMSINIDLSNQDIYEKYLYN